ncbi:MAG: class I SAM-dependent methyltransferase [Hyphomonas sp.]
MIAPFDLDEWCLQCGLDPVADKQWKSASLSEVSYPDNAHNAFAELEHRSFWFNHRNAVITGLVKKYPPGGTIFDVGGGNGYVSLGLREAGFDTVVVEPGAHAVRVASERGLPVIAAAFQDLRIPAESIPAIGMFDVLEHIEDDLLALKSQFTSLVPGGMLYLAVPSLPALWSGEDISAGHYRRYRLEDLEARVKSAGFEPLHGTYFFSILTAPVFFLRAIPHRLGFRGKQSAETAAKAHNLPGGPAGGFIDWRLRRERSHIGAGGRPRLGTSCFLAARKPD